ncbi:hypothetical protein [Tardiphaga sp. 42S5]|uniref:hypothetical protein n=1 Tax=Tardiphaga sp. 42S5 TaxID=1404799 RepID=UPI002A59C6BC|nr:hypothetical protein [Tardiphaga sp. 42S5]WPO40281.1 hypothetical protein SFY93_22460 [Tardiphaga sp. 42S5]
MDWSVIILLALVGVFFLWRSSKNEEKAKVASARLESDTKLYQHIKTGMREYNFREHEGQFWKAKDGKLLFDTAHMSAFHVDHFAETRVGFYFRDLQEYGLYGGFAGNGDEFHDSYYRTDRTFRKEEVLVTLDG